MAEAKRTTAGYHDEVTGSATPPVTLRGAARIAPAGSGAGGGTGRLIGAIAMVSALYFAKDVLIPITLAILLSFVLAPVVNLLQRLRLWRAPAVMVTVLLALGIIVLAGTLIGSQIAGLSAKAPRYAQTIEGKVTSLQSLAVAQAGRITSALSKPRSGPRKAPLPARITAAPPAGAPSGARPEGARPVPVEVVQPQASALTVVRTILDPVLGPLGTTAIVLIVAIFILMQKEDLRDRFIRLFGSNDLRRTTLAMVDAGERLSRYYLSQLAVNASFGVVIGIGLWLIGIPSAALWGLLAGLLRFVPYVGSFLAAVPPLALAAAVEPGWGMAIEVAALFVIVEPVTGYVVEPMLYGHSTGLSPVSVVVSALFWTWIWGPIGLILSTPLTLCLVVLGRHVKSLEFLDVLLGDRPALTPVESFYQRVLADDPDEVLEQAEALVAESSLLDYYDDVVLPALKLAAEDEAQGTIDPAQAAEMTRSMLGVVDELKDEEEAGESAAPPSSLPAGLRVACIAGRGSFDDAVSAMLAQLVTRHGGDALAVPHGDLARDRIGALDLADVQVVAISALQLRGSPAALRHLIRRLRQAAPAARIVTGLWPEGEAVLTAAALQATIGADRYVVSLRQALDAIGEAAAAGSDADTSVAAD